MCQPIVPFSIWDMAAGYDTGCQGSGALKTADGRLWTPTNLTPIEAAVIGWKIGFKKGDKICP